MNRKKVGWILIALGAAFLICYLGLLFYTRQSFWIVAALFLSLGFNTAGVNFLLFGKRRRHDDD